MNIKYIFKCMVRNLNFYLFKQKKDLMRINLCSADQKVDGYFSIDYDGDVDLKLDLRLKLLPIRDKSIKSIICISAINYFTRERAFQIIKDCHRVLEVGGIARFAVQDMELISKKYIEKDINFFFQKDENGNERFEGETLGDKYAAWFYGYQSIDSCKYFYDYGSLRNLFLKSGVTVIEKKEYMESNLSNIASIDNRQDQMFFLEAIKT